jgi:DNA polymerase-1
VICQLWAADFEFGPGPAPRCLVAREILTGTLIQVWEDDLLDLMAAPFDTDEQAALVAYYLSAEAKCFLKLGWPLPAHCIDLFAEFRCLTNGRSLSGGNSLLDALSYFGIPSITTAEKDSMRHLAIRGGPWTEAERSELLAYCQTDVDALCALWPCMSTRMGWPL